MYLYTISNAQNKATMNKVISLPRTYSWQYRYEADGCIFTLEQNENGTWYLTGYDSEELMEDGDYFISEAMDLKRHAVHFLKCTFQRTEWAAA